MARTALSIPAVRQKARLRSQIIDHRVKIAEHREKLAAKRAELAAMQPRRRQED